MGTPHQHPAGEVAIAFAPDGSWASGGAEGAVLVAEGGGPATALASAGAPVTWLEYDPGAAFLLVKRADDSTEIWDLAAPPAAGPGAWSLFQSSGLPASQLLVWPVAVASHTGPVLDEILMSLIAGGHALLVGVPGLAKTLMVRSLSEAVHLEFRRI